MPPALGLLHGAFRPRLLAKAPLIADRLQQAPRPRTADRKPRLHPPSLLSCRPCKRCTMRASRGTTTLRCNPRQA